MKTGEWLKDPQAYADMDYLCSEAAQSRSVIAAHLLRECPHVLELGGFKTPITLYLTGRHESVTVVDPLMRDYEADSLNGYPCRVRHISQPFQNLGLKTDETWGFVMLGASLKHFSEDAPGREQEWNALVAMVTAARVAVIEAAVDWPLGKEILDRLVELPGIEVRASIDLDLSANPGMDPDHYRRRLLLLSPEGDRS